jgi:hypothetical protein
VFDSCQLVKQAMVVAVVALAAEVLEAVPAVAASASLPIVAGNKKRSWLFVQARTLCVNNFQGM